VSLRAGKLAEAIRTQPPGKDDRIVIRLGSHAPPIWTLTGVLFSKGAGMSMFNLTLAYNGNLHIGDSVARSFFDLYSPETADAAIIHADPQWTQLAAGAYKPPLVTTPTFAGAFWANYLGPGHLKNFSVAKLKTIRAYRTEWRGDRAMFFLSAAALEDALTSGGENELRRLTGEFREAKL
jgi:hypothetical protein